MEIQIAFSNRIDVQRYNYFSFTLNALDKRNGNIEISVDYGPTHDKPGRITALVWAGFADGELKRYLYAEDVSQSDFDLEDYVGLARHIHDSPVFQKELTGSIEWSYKTGMK